MGGNCVKGSYIGISPCPLPRSAGSGGAINIVILIVISFYGRQLTVQYALWKRSFRANVMGWQLIV